MSDLDRLGRAVLLFHRGGQWTGQDRNEWVMLTGEEDATTKVLCDLARKLLAAAHTERRAVSKPETTDAVARTKADPNRSRREDQLVAEIERLRVENAQLRAAFLREPHTQGDAP
jgi:hypothetical protein